MWADRSIPVSPGDTVAGRYLVDRVIGRGGMGVVVAATHVELGRPVALKFLLDDAMEAPDQVARFLQEGRAAANLTSDHVTRVFDVGRLEGGVPYLVMELLVGRNLGEELQARGPMPVPLVVDWILQACEALGEAHARGIVHRDLKPENLFLVPQAEGSGFVKVLDFGISKSVGGIESPSLTATDSIMGSPSYMSPEQLKSTKNVDARTDLWSLGVILYELLTGAVPYKAESIAALAFAIAEGPPPSPSALRADIPVALGAVILRCLERNRDLRCGSIAELERSLAPFADPAALAALKKSNRGYSIAPSQTGPGQIVSVPPAALAGWTPIALSATERAPTRRASLGLITLVLLLAAALSALAVVRLNGRRTTAATVAPEPSAPTPSSAPPSTSGPTPTPSESGAVPAVSATTAPPQAPPPTRAPPPSSAKRVAKPPAPPDDDVHLNQRK